MPRGSVAIEIHASCDVVFDTIHNYDCRLDWDSMLREAKVIAPYQSAGRGVRTRCVGSWKLGHLVMDTEYVSFERGRVAAVKLVNQPLFFESFNATIRHDPVDETRSRVTYIYSFRARPRWLATQLEPIMNAVLRRETTKRLQALRSFLEARAPTTTTSA